METQKSDKRKVLLMLPLLVTPLLGLCFYAMGGGKVAAGSRAASGINASLPDANFKKQEPLDKMGFYASGGRDTSVLEDPGQLAGALAFKANTADQKATEIDAKLAALDMQLNSTAVLPRGGKSSVMSQSSNLPVGGNSMKADLDRLEMLMQSIKADKGTDPEMQQMNGLLEKIIDIQNPSRSQQKILSQEDGNAPEKEFLAVPAELADNIKVIQGATIRLRLLDSVLLKNLVVPSGHFVFGICRIVNQRLLLDIRTIRLGELIIPVNLSVYGMDGMAGIAAKEAVVGDVASWGAVDAVSGISVYGMQGLTGQVTGAGIDAAKSLFKRKLRAVRVKLHAGDKVLLRINKS